MSPNCILVRAHVPTYIVNTGVSLYFGAIKIFQHPEQASTVLRTFAPHMLSIHSSILEIGYASLTVVEFKRL